MAPEDTRTPEELGPYLQAAFVCEKVLQERDGVMSAIRIIDTHSRVAVGGPVVMEPFDYPMCLLIAFKSGEALGTYQISITPIRPDTNEKLPPMSMNVNFEAPAYRGVGIAAQLAMRFEVPGVWYFDVELEGEGRPKRRVTRIPFRVIYLPQPAQKNHSHE